jgi:hypothetical protein
VDSSGVEAGLKPDSSVRQAEFTRFTSADAVMEVREAPVYTESDTPEVSSCFPAVRERRKVSNRRQGFWKLVLSACDEIGILMTKEKLAKMSEDQSDEFYARIFETEVYKANRERNFALRKKALKEAPCKPWGNKNMRERLMRC